MKKKNIFPAFDTIQNGGIFYGDLLVYQMVSIHSN